MKEAGAGAVEFSNFDIRHHTVINTHYFEKAQTFTLCTYDAFKDLCKVPESFAHKCPNNVKSEDNLKHPFSKN